MEIKLQEEIIIISKFNINIVIAGLAFGYSLFDFFNKSAV
jgi:hypothetical protein